MDFVRVLLYRLPMVLIVFVCACATYQAPEDNENTAARFWDAAKAELLPADERVIRELNIPARPEGERSIVGVSPQELSDMMLDHIKRILASHPEWDASLAEYVDFEREHGIRTHEQRIGMRTRFIQYLLGKEAGR